ncbi:transcription factor e(y)2-domain-containing protein [Lobosporangium transversale]|uniref:Transcription and mRNA export factor SUS1 n=1 Tax=Lobosporangium transversale TaxID=64571 RepID=A0A1Y2GC29_9FUNG|nr:transcription factor e(y)2-domain-containing protein [Lobosporangium transversale]ORZ06746.1 transcription factor e(y)2-domain-containing protein [Lobosporangium transversale]|eukprot:XP_021877667.1 transcription factor e(y)2-domain-containing protein [Lobosporangium transversale]
MSSVTSDHLRSNLHRELVESGKRDQLVELLRAKLIDSGWRDDLKAYTREKIQSKDSSMTVDEIIKEVSPYARATIPDKIKTELLTQISAFVEENL